MILLDTHVVLWARSGKRLRPAARKALTSAESRMAIGISSITAWEIGMLASQRRIDLGMPTGEFVAELFARRDVTEFPVTAGIGIRAAELPETFPGNPVDRILVATSIEHAIPILTRDARILTFAETSATFSVIAS